MDPQAEASGTGPNAQCSTLPLSSLLFDCLRAAVRGRGLRHIGGGRYAARHFHELEPACAWGGAELASLAEHGLLEFVCTTEFALPTDAAYRLLDGVA